LPAPPFDEAAARAALSALAARVGACTAPGGVRITGAGTVRVSFLRDGTVLSVFVDQPYGSSPIATCIMATFRPARVAPFSGPLPTVIQPFTIR
jgi:hypothetical protein